MSRYDNQQELTGVSSFSQSIAQESVILDDEKMSKSNNDLAMSHEQHSSLDENKSEQQLNISNDPMTISADSINQRSTDSLDYHSIETDLSQIFTRRTTSENSLHSTSSIPTYENYSFSTSCLMEKNDVTSVTNENKTEENSLTKTTSASLFDRMKAFVSKPVEIVQDTVENRHKPRTLDSNINESPSLTINDKEPLTTQHFQSAYDLHDEEKSKLVRSPELYNMTYAIKFDNRSLLTSSQIQYRTLSESALATEDPKRQTTSVPSNETSTEYLPTISNDTSLEILQPQKRFSTPFDDAIEKESSPEQSESYNIPSTAFSDVLEPTSSCQRPLVFCKNDQQQQIRNDEDLYRIANDLVHQVLREVVSELTGEQDETSSSKDSERLSINSPSSSSSSSDNDDDELREQDEEEQQLLDNRKSSIKILRRAQTDAKDFDLVQSSMPKYPPMIRCNSQSDTEAYFRTTLSPSIKEFDNSSSDEKNSNRNSKLLVQDNEKYSGEGEDSSGGKQRTTQRRKRSSDMMNPSDANAAKSLPFKHEFGENINRRESLDSPSIDLSEKLILKSLQEGILRTNLKSLQTELELTQQPDDYFYEQIYSSATKKPTSYYDYDAESETDRDDLKKRSTNNDIKHQSEQWKSSSNEIQELLDDLIDSIHYGLPMSISSEPISSQSDATTVIFNSTKNSMDDEDNFGQSTSKSSHELTQEDNSCLMIPLSSSSSSASSSSQTHSVIYNQQSQLSQRESNLTSSVNTTRKKQSSIPSLSNIELIDPNTKTKFHSHPGSLGGSQIPPSSKDDESNPATSTTYQSSN